MLAGTADIASLLHRPRRQDYRECPHFRPSLLRAASEGVNGAIMPTPQSELIERLRVLLTGEPSTREVSMFGGRPFMVNEKMVVSALKEGALLVRVPPDEHDELTTHPGAEQAEMGVGRSMGPGWVSVSASAIDTDERLSFWLTVALDYNRTTATSHR